jgi:hypothetical protein
MAPKNFRRLRSGKRFLPKRRKGDMTGALLRRYPSREGDEVAEAVTRIPDPEYMAHVRACVKQEQELVFEDERRIATNRFCMRWGLPLSKVPPVQAFLLPPVKVRAEPVLPAFRPCQRNAFDSSVQPRLLTDSHIRSGHPRYAPASLSFAGSS